MDNRHFVASNRVAAILLLRVCGGGLDDGLYTSLYGERLYYPYHALLLYNFERKATYTLDNAMAARRYFRMFAPNEAKCDE